MDFLIRKALHKDLAAVYKIENEWSGTWKLDQYRSELDKGSFFFIAEYNREVAGYAVVCVAADEADLLRIAVAKKMRRNKAGTHLMDYIISFCRQKECNAVYLEVGSDNSNAITFYMKHGFEQTGYRKNYYADDGALIMAKKL
jgi:ribosomal-protein-alanine N-acetyltransferase